MSDLVTDVFGELLGDGLVCGVRGWRRRRRHDRFVASLPRISCVASQGGVAGDLTAHWSTGVASVGPGFIAFSGNDQSSRPGAPQTHQARFASLHVRSIDRGRTRSPAPEEAWEIGSSKAVLRVDTTTGVVEWALEPADVELSLEEVAG